MGKALGAMLLLRACVIIHRIRHGSLQGTCRRGEKHDTSMPFLHSLIHSFILQVSTIRVPDTIWVQITTSQLAKGAQNR